MGGRGASSSKKAIGNRNSILGKGEAKELYLSRSMERSKSVLIAEVDSKGRVYLRPASDEEDGVKGKPSGTIQVKHGIVKGKTVNLNLEYAREVSGQTFENKETIKQAGFGWSSYKKVYYNKRLPSKEINKYYEEFE